MTETLIKIENLHKSFGKNEVLKGINLEIKRGEVVVIIGPSGSGKSTLLRSMNLLEEATKGKVIFEGVDITDKKNDLFAMREKMGMVFQQIHRTKQGRFPAPRRTDDNDNFSTFNLEVDALQYFILSKGFM